jgi:ubiquinone/menaquinone biosynthesis C-methylase UbiE
VTAGEAPGKRELVARGFALAGLRAGARVADLGCGLGTSVDLLRRSLGLRAIGVDLAAPAGAGAPIPRLRADARHLPLTDGVLEGVLLECVLSLVPDRGAVLRECARALAPAGKLILMDLHAREAPDGAARHGPGPCGVELLPGEALVGLVASSGFDVLRFEDHSGVLKEYLFRLIMAPEDERRWPLDARPERGDGTEAASKRIRPGYCLLVAERHGP